MKKTDKKKRSKLPQTIFGTDDRVEDPLKQLTDFFTSTIKLMEIDLEANQPQQYDEPKIIDFIRNRGYWEFKEGKNDSHTDAPQTQIMEGRKNLQPIVVSDRNNSFIFSGDAWKVRFNGGKEEIVRQSDGINYLVSYLHSPNKIIEKEKLYAALKSAPPEQAQVPYDEDLRVVNDSNINKDDTKVLSYEDRQKLQDHLQDLLKRAELNIAQGAHKDGDEKLECFEKSVIFLEKEYGVNVLRDSGEIQANPFNSNGERNYGRENVARSIRAAITKLNHIEGLTVHLQKYLNVRASCKSKLPHFII